LAVSCIAISGPHGAGTSSVGKKLARRLSFRFISAGKIFRESAEKRGIEIGKFNEIVEGDPYLRDALDEMMKEEASKGQVVIEGRMSGWIAKDIADLRVFLTASFEVRVERIANRDGKDLEVVRNETEQREKEAREWFLKTYDVDIMNESAYNLVIDTTNLNIDSVVEMILELARRNSS
jgi:cytidylate kinase